MKQQIICRFAARTSQHTLETLSPTVMRKNTRVVSTLCQCRLSVQNAGAAALFPSHFLRKRTCQQSGQLHNPLRLS